MRTHIKTFHIRFTEKEYERLCKHAEKAGLPKTTYIRHMINGCSPCEQPSYDFWAFVKEIHYIGVNLNQLCRMAHQFGNIHAGRLDEVLKEHNRLFMELYHKVILPAKVDVTATLEQGRLLAEKELSEEEQTNAK